MTTLFSAPGQSPPPCHGPDALAGELIAMGYSPRIAATDVHRNVQLAGVALDFFRRANAGGPRFDIGALRQMLIDPRRWKFVRDTDGNWHAPRLPRARKKRASRANVATQAKIVLQQTIAHVRDELRHAELEAAAAQERQELWDAAGDDVRESIRAAVGAELPAFIDRDGELFADRCKAELWRRHRSSVAQSAGHADGPPV